MGDLISEATLLEQHQYRVSKRASFRPELQAFEACQICDPHRDRGTEHDGQPRKMVGPAWFKSSQLDRPCSVGRPGTDKIGQSRPLHCWLAESAFDQWVTADQSAPVIGEKRVGRQRRAAA